MLKDTFRDLSNQALKNKDADTRRIMNSIMAKFLEVEKSGTFTGWTESLEQDTIRSYIKSLQKAIEQLGDSPVAQAYQREIAVLSGFMPKLMDEAETRALIEPLVPQCKNMGQLMGMVMKTHKDKIDPALVRKVAMELGLK